MITEKPKAILFDWDSTLAQTRPTVVKALEQTLTHFNKAPWEKTKHLRQPLLSLKDNFPLIFKEDAPTAYQFYLQVYQPELTVPAADAKDFLSLCLKNNIAIHIISNKERSLLLKEVKLCYPDISFTGILAYGDAQANKPSAEPVKKALQYVPYSINAQNVWLVGDSLPDTECAYNANIQPILIGHNIKDEVYLNTKRHTTPALIEVASFNELTDLLKNL